MYKTADTLCWSEIAALKDVSDFYFLKPVILYNFHKPASEFLCICVTPSDIGEYLYQYIYIHMEKEMATHSSTLAWRIPWMEEPGGLQFTGLQRVRHDSDFIFFLSIVPFGEKDGNPLQCSCLESPMDKGAWWAAVYGIAKRRTWLSN